MPAHADPQSLNCHHSLAHQHVVQAGMRQLQSMTSIYDNRTSNMARKSVKIIKTISAQRSSSKCKN